MKILFFGRGAVGTQYAWAFEKAGHTVEFFVRAGRASQYGSYVNMEMIDTRRSKTDRMIQEKWPVVIREELSEDHDYDLIFVSVNPEQVSSVVQYLAPRISKSIVLFAGNIWKNVREASEPLPFSQVVWGFPGCGGGFEGNTLYGGLYKMVFLEASKAEPTEQERVVRKLFSEAGFQVITHKNFQSWLMNHYVANAAMEAEVLKSGSFREVVSSQEALAGMARNLKEMVPILKAKGAKIDVMTKVLRALPPRVVGFLMSKIIYSPRGMFYALQAHNHYQVGHAVREMIDEARTHDIETPRLCEAEKLISES